MKAIKCLGLCYFMACIFMACGSSSSKNVLSVTGENGQVYESYQECCAANDFQAAHLFLARLQNSNEENEKYEEAKEYIFKNEALYLMSQDDENAKKRIVYLLKEGGNDDHVSMLIDLAIENDDDAFVRTLANQYKEDVSEERLKKLMEYLSEKSDEENANFIDNYISKYLTISNTSLLKYIAGNKGQNNSEKVLGYLTIIEKDIPTRPALGLIKSNHYGRLDDQYDNYNTAIKNYNDACQTILNVAITSKNLYLAQRVITKTKPSLTFKELGDWVQVVEKHRDHSSLYNAFNVTLDNTEINSIKAAYQEAVRSGAFK